MNIKSSTMDLNISSHSLESNKSEKYINDK